LLHQPKIKTVKLREERENQLAWEIPEGLMIFVEAVAWQVMLIVATMQRDLICFVKYGGV